MADPFGKEAHEKAGFKPLTDGNWVLPGSNDKGYNCTQYAVGKLTGKPPQRGDEDDTVGTDKIEAWLKKNGFLEEKAPSEKCGCKEGQTKTCAVLYFDKPPEGESPPLSREPIHIAVFDPDLCDWGGKANAGSPIRRFCKPGDYPTDPAERKRTEMKFYCRSKPLGENISDAELHKSANKIGDGKPLLGHKFWIGMAVGAVAGAAVKAIVDIFF